MTQKLVTTKNLNDHLAIPLMELQDDHDGFLSSLLSGRLNDSLQE